MKTDANKSVQLEKGKMTVQEIENNVKHRPWEIPKGKWKFYQEWNRVIFLHWKVNTEDLKTFVPKELEIDTIKGNAWVSLVAFTMEKISLKNLFPFPPISNFDEINIRTYVKSNNKTGVYFLSIEGGKRLSCQIAKGISELPYRYSKINRTSNKYESVNQKYQDKLNLEFKIGQLNSEKSKLENWLTERYALFQDSGDYINEFEIHHQEWQLYNLEIKNLSLDYPRFGKLINMNPDKIGYSNGVQVIAWDKLKKKKNGYKH